VIGGAFASWEPIPLGVLRECRVEPRSAVQLPEDVVEDLRRRLRRAAGQVNGVETMLAEGRECRDVVTQLSAATRALEQVGFRLIASGLTYCVEHPEEAEASGYPIDEVQRLFTKLT
jgi:DNA-binding FrmR family transcriptional regulator